MSMGGDLSRLRTPRSALALAMDRRCVLSLSNAKVDVAGHVNPGTKFNPKKIKLAFRSARGG